MSHGRSTGPRTIAKNVLPPTLLLSCSMVFPRSALSLITCSSCVLDCSQRTCQLRTSSALVLSCFVFWFGKEDGTRGRTRVSGRSRRSEGLAPHLAYRQQLLLVALHERAAVLQRLFKVFEVVHVYRELRRRA